MGVGEPSLSSGPHAWTANILPTGSVLSAAVKEFNTLSSFLYFFSTTVVFKLKWNKESSPLDLALRVQEVRTRLTLKIHSHKR